MEVKILHLYADILNLYGEYGNVVLLKKHIEDQGFTVQVEKKTVGDEVKWEQYACVYMGAGTEKNLEEVRKDILRFTSSIYQAIEEKTVFLATGNSMELFGKKIGKEEGLAIFDYETIRTKERITSDVIYRWKETAEQESERKVVGFINKMTETYHNMSPLFQVEFGVGENKRNDYEGTHYLNFYGTHLSGPILTKNPAFLKHMVMQVAQKVEKKFQYQEKEYPYEEASYQFTLQELEKRKEMVNS